MDKGICLWEENVRKVTPYTPGEQPAGKRNIKLNTNENPYPPAPGVEQALKNIDADLLRRYPGPSGGAVRAAIAGLCGVSKEKIFLGVGSDEVLALAFLTFFNGEKPILFPDITYSFYDVWAELYGIPYERIPLDPDFRICKEDYCKPCGGIVLANPNAPTGVELAQEELEEIIEAHKDWPGALMPVLQQAQEVYGYLPISLFWINMISFSSFGPFPNPDRSQECD